MNWSKSAIECYKRGGVCNGCPIFKIIENRCRMKQSLIKLIKKIGLPPVERKDIIDD